MSNSPLTGSLYFFKGFTLLTKPNIRQRVLIPLLINVILLTALIYLGWLQYEILFDLFTKQLPNWLSELDLPKNLLPDFKELIVAAEGFLWIFIIIITLILIFLIFTIVGNLISGPFNALLAEAVEIHLTGKSVHSPSQPWYGFLIGISWKPIEKLLYYFSLIIMLLIVSVIPIINYIAPLLWLLFITWLVSLEYTEVPMENHGYNMPTIRYILTKKRMVVLGFGLTTLLVMFIPLVNFLVMPVAVAGATCMWVSESAPSII
ncbi:sulfate transporter CysZ [Candidatus Parabeggiatoa sp. HSG14]|uniref:sulfate transporter CysZ n=1 Tax=Candidatus Parabeggiatoa sp. HSG14 TaxID=3055593 RepID=UPI0025A87D1C|nr:sulfate transporter CysZ [Thiotrichales bacterium HSG14]